MTASRPVPVQRLTREGAEPATRVVPVEAPIAIDYNGIGYAVMMATPEDLHDYAVGFSLSERIVVQADEVEEVEVQQVPQGWLLRIRIAGDRFAPVVERVRVRVSDSSCGLCGLENLEQALRPLPRLLSVGEAIAPAAIFRALEGLDARQPLNARTGGVHAAAFCEPSGVIVMAREDIGRHNALDKLIGALAREGRSPATGFFLLSSRCSYELVEKAVLAGCPTLVTISTATSLAVDRAREAGLTLIALARPDSALLIAGN